MFEYFIECLGTILIMAGVFVIIPAIVNRILFGILILNKDEEVDEMSTKFKRYEKMFNYMLDIR